MRPESACRSKASAYVPLFATALAEAEAQPAN